MLQFRHFPVALIKEVFSDKKLSGSWEAECLDLANLAVEFATVRLGITGVGLVVTNAGIIPGFLPATFAV